MAETPQQKTHKKAKGKTINGKSGRATTRRPRATAKSIRKRKKAPTQAKKEQEATAGNAGGADSVPSGTRGIDHLRQEADLYLQKNSKELIEGIGEAARKGHHGHLRSIVELANATPTVPAASHDRLSLSAGLRALDSETADRQPEVSESNLNPERGDLPEPDASGLAA